jgi:hypothetical protein
LNQRSPVDPSASAGLPSFFGWRKIAASFGRLRRLSLSKCRTNPGLPASVPTEGGAGRLSLRLELGPRAVPSGRAEGLTHPFFFFIFCLKRMIWRIRKNSEEEDALKICDSDSKTIALRPAFRGIRLKRGNGLKSHKDEDLSAIKSVMSEVQCLKFLNGGDLRQVIPANTGVNGGRKWKLKDSPKKLDENSSFIRKR